MKSFLLCNASPNQRALANKIHAVLPLAGIALVQPAPGKWRPGRWQRLSGILAGVPFRKAWFAMQEHCAARFPGGPEAPLTHHKGVNSPGVTDLIDQVRPDLVIVTGNDLLKQPLIDRVVACGGRIVNLHTGISPYIKRGPKCTNWCLAINQPELIGNTVMWIDAGIDSGNIIATERTPLDRVRTLTELHVAVMEHTHDLYCRTVARLRDGMPVPSVPRRELGEGRLFLTRHWTAAKAIRAGRNFRRLRPLSSRSSGRRLVDLAGASA